MKLKLMCNGHIPPVHQEAPPGKWRNVLYMGRRVEITIDNPEIEQAIEEALDYGFKPELWIESITEE